MKNYFVHMRVKAFIPSFLFVLTGYALSPLKTGVVDTVLTLISLFFVYSVLLFGGAAAINSHFDQDSGPLNFLDKPPELPKNLHIFSYGLFALSVVLSLMFFNKYTATFVLISSVLGIVYSQPLVGRKRAKDIPVLDNFVNALGCGVLSVLIGRSVTATSISDIFTMQTLLVGGAFTFTVAGTYPATQIFQFKTARQTELNYSTFLGPKKALQAGLGLIVVGLSLLGVLFFKSQYPRNFGTAGILQFLFFLCVGMGMIRLLQWSRKDDILKYKMGAVVLACFLVGRIFWIAAAWISHDI